MQWLEIHIDTNHQGLTAVEDFLSAQGIDSIVIDDEGEFRDFLENNRRYWDYVDEDLLKAERGKSRITFYLEANEAGFSALAQVRTALQSFKAAHPECGSLLMTLDNLRESDWENNWKQYYKPMKIGNRLFVVPEWEQADAGDRIPLILNPGLTFGTGSHATTRLCLAALEERIHGGETVLDLGCGSGILSIAALKLGAARAFACDIDDKCLDVAYENASLNGIGKDVYTVRTGDVLKDRRLRAEIGGGYDVVLANIVADVIIALAPMVKPMLAPGGVFICSGVISDRAAEVSNRLLQAGLAVLESHGADGWFVFVCR